MFNASPSGARRRKGRVLVSALLGLAATVLGVTATTGTASAEPRHQIAHFDIPASGNMFGGGTIYYPTDVHSKVGAIAISPGLYGNKTALAWLGERLAHEGFAVIDINTKDPNSMSATDRANQLQDALHFLANSRIKDKVDDNRRAVVGYSLGGGGALDVAKRNPNLKAAVGIAPYETMNYSSVHVPTMIFTSSGDTVAKPQGFGGKFYQQLSGPKEYLQYHGIAHEDMQLQRELTGNFVSAWLHNYVDGDHQAAKKTLCPAPSGNPQLDNAQQMKVCS